MIRILNFKDHNELLETQTAVGDDQIDETVAKRLSDVANLKLGLVRFAKGTQSDEQAADVLTV